MLIEIAQAVVMGGGGWPGLAENCLFMCSVGYVKRPIWGVQMAVINCQDINYHDECF